MMCQGGLKVPGTALDANVLTKLQVAVEGDDEDRAVGFQMQEVGTRTDRAENPVGETVHTSSKGLSLAVRLALPTSP